MLGVGLAIAAAVCWGAGTVFARLGLQNIRVPTGTFISMLSSVLLVALAVAVLNLEDVSRLSLTALLWFSLVGIVNYVIGRQFNYLSVKYIGAAKAATLFSSSPLFAMALAVTLIGESINLMIVAGTIIIVVGLYMVISSK